MLYYFTTVIFRVASHPPGGAWELPGITADLQATENSSLEKSTALEGGLFGILSAEVSLHPKSHPPHSLPQNL